MQRRMSTIDVRTRCHVTTIPILLISIIITLSLSLSPLLSTAAPLGSGSIGVCLPTGDADTAVAAAANRAQSIFSLGLSDLLGGTLQQPDPNTGGAGESLKPLQIGGGTITLVTSDTAGASGGMGAFVAVRKAVENSYSSGGGELLGMIGSITADTTKEVSILSSSYELPMLNPFIGSASLSDSSSHAYHVRLAPNDELLAQAIYRALVKSRWYRVALISLDDLHSLAIFDLLSNLLASHATQRIYNAEGVYNGTSTSTTVSTFEVATFILPASHDDFDNSDRTKVVVDQMLDSLVSDEYRIFVVIGGAGGSTLGRSSVSSRIIASIFDSANSRGLIGTDVNPEGSKQFVREQWIGVGFCDARSEVETILRDKYPNRNDGIYTGLQCVTSPVPRVTSSVASSVNAAAVAFQTRLRAHNSTLFPPDYRLTSEDCRAYDTMILIGWALQALFTDSAFASVANNATGFQRALFHVIQTQQPFMRGIEGKRMNFSLPVWSGSTVSQIPESILSVDYLNWYGLESKHTDTGFEQVGTYDPTLKTADYSRLNVYMSDGTHVYPKDRTQVYVDGDEMPAAQLDTQWIVLSYCVAVLGVWSAVILIEQGIAAWYTGKKFMALGWNFLSGICFGPCAVFLTFALNLCAIQLDTITIRFRQDYFALSIVFMILPVTFIWSVGCEEESKLRVKNPSDRYAMTRPIGTKTDSVTRSGGGRSGTSKQQAPSRSSMQSFIASVSVMEQLRQLASGLRADYEMLRDKFHFHSIAFMGLFSILIVLNFEVLMSSVRTNATWERPIGSYFAAACFLWVILWPSLMIIFHGGKSAMRYVVPFLLAGGILGTHYILMSEVKWTYLSRLEDAESEVNHSQQLLNDQYPSSDLLSSDTLVVTIAAICFAVECLCIVYNVNALRMTKNLLDRVLGKVKEQVSNIQEEIRKEDMTRKGFEDATRFARRSIEIINLCRPVFRTYALALALAEPVHEVASLEQAYAGTDTKHHKRGGSSNGGGSGGFLALPSKRTSGIGSVKSQSGSRGSRVSVDKRTPAPGAGGAAGGADDLKEVSKSASGVVAPFIPVHDTAVSPLDHDGGDAVEASQTATSKTSPVTAAAAIAGGTINVAPKGQPATRIRAKPTATSSIAPPNHAKSAAMSLVNGSDFSLVHAAKKDASVLAIMRELREFNFTEPLPNSTASTESLSPLSPIAVHARLTSDIRLPQLLSNPVTVELLKDVLSKQLSPENMALWIDIQRYRSLESVAARRAVADEIYQLYIVNGARFEVNLSSSMKAGFEARMTRGRMALDLFDEIEREIYKLMQLNNFGELMASPAFSKLAGIILGQKDYHLRNVIPVSSGGTSVAASQVAGYSTVTFGIPSSPPVAAATGAGHPAPALIPDRRRPSGTLPVPTLRFTNTAEPTAHQALLASSQPNSRRPSVDVQEQHHQDPQRNALVDGVNIPKMTHTHTNLVLQDLRRAASKGHDDSDSHRPIHSPAVTPAPTLATAAVAHTPSASLGSATLPPSVSRKPSPAAAASLSLVEIEAETRKLIYPGAQSNITGGGDRALEEEVDRLVNPGREVDSLVNPGRSKSSNTLSSPTDVVRRKSIIGGPPATAGAGAGVSVSTGSTVSSGVTTSPVLTIAPTIKATTHNTTNNQHEPKGSDNAQ